MVKCWYASGESTSLRPHVPVLISIPILCIAVYRLTLHPLARYPGPFLAKITDAYAGYHGWAGDVHLDAQRLHKRYGMMPDPTILRVRRLDKTAGSFLRYGPNRLLVNTSSGLRGEYSPSPVLVIQN